MRCKLFAETTMLSPKRWLYKAPNRSRMILRCVSRTCASIILFSTHISFHSYYFHSYHFQLVGSCSAGRHARTAPTDADWCGKYSYCKQCDRPIDNIIANLAQMWAMATAQGFGGAPQVDWGRKLPVSKKRITTVEVTAVDIMPCTETMFIVGTV